jgi:hypothetical protein
VEAALTREFVIATAEPSNLVTLSVAAALAIHDVPLSSGAGALFVVAGRFWSVIVAFYTLLTLPIHFVALSVAAAGGLHIMAVRCFSKARAHLKFTCLSIEASIA